MSLVFEEDTYEEPFKGPKSLSFFGTCPFVHVTRYTVVIGGGGSSSNSWGMSQPSRIKPTQCLASVLKKFLLNEQTLTNSTLISPNIKWETKWSLKYLPMPRFKYLPTRQFKRIQNVYISSIYLVLSNTSVYLLFKRNMKYKTIKNDHENYTNVFSKHDFKYGSLKNVIEMCRKES